MIQNILKKIKDWVIDQDWLILMPGATGLIILSWRIGKGHQWSFFWISVTTVVVIWEMISRYFFPEKETISDVFRSFRKKNPIYAWIILTIWMLFSWSLILHLAV